MGLFSGISSFFKNNKDSISSGLALGSFGLGLAETLKGFKQQDLINKQVKEQSDTLKVATQQKDELYKEVTELRFKTNLLQEEILSLKNVQSENQILKNKLYDKDLEIKYLRDKHEEMVNVLVKELKVIKQETLLSE